VHARARTIAAAASLDAIEFLIYSRAAAGDREVDPALTEEHWSYMDGFAEGMVARGPTLGPDRASWTGSLHILDLPSADAAHEFVEREPYNRAGLFEQHLIRRFDNLLGRTMWEAPAGSDDPRFLVIAHMPDADGHGPALRLPDVTTPARERLIVHGRLLTPEEGRPVGVALALQAATRPAVEALLENAQTLDVQVVDWELGGRR
jgi:uncharacterized protein YciI